MVDGTPSGLVLQRLAIIAARAVRGAGAVSITVVRGRAVSSAGSTGGAGAALQDCDVTLVEVAAAVVATTGQDPTGC